MWLCQNTGDGGDGDEIYAMTVIVVSLVVIVVE